MYIRRKVFSVLNVDGEERYFSTTDVELEDKKKGMSKAAKAALVTGAGLATAASTVYGAKKGLLGNRAGMAVNKAIMRAAGKAGKKGVFENAAKDYAIQAVKKADNIKNVKTMDAAGKKEFLKRVAAKKKQMMNAFDVEQAAKSVKKSTNTKGKPKLLN